MTGALEAAEDWLVAYVPTFIFSGFVVVWSAILAAEAASDSALSDIAKLIIALLVSALAVLAIYASSFWAARVLASQHGGPPPSRVEVARAGWWELLAAFIATLAWVSILPSSWIAVLGVDTFVLPLIAFVVSVLLKFLGMIFGPLKVTDDG